MNLMFITNDINLAQEAENAGVNRIFVDLEINGKLERQGHLDTHIGNHVIDDIGRMKKNIIKSEVLVRINPYHTHTKKEIDKCIELGADIIMLPMFKTKDEVQQFIKYVNGRAKVCLLLETAQAFVRIHEIIELEGIDEIHIGLNDLHLSLGLDFMFELLGEGLVDYLANIIKAKGIKFGFGGIARIGEGVIPAELILGEHYRIQSEMVILSRAFRNKSKSFDKTANTVNIVEEINKIRECESNIKNWTNHQFLCNKKIVKEKVTEIAQRIRTSKKI